MIRALSWVAGLTLIFAGVVASFAPADLLLGAGLSALLLAAARRFIWTTPGAPGRELGSRVVAFWPFAWAVAREVVVGTWEVALVVLHVRPLRAPGIVAVPIGERTPSGVAVAALTTTLSPGAVLIDVDEERGVMLLHVLDASDPDRVRADQQRFYERHQRRVFP